MLRFPRGPRLQSWRQLIPRHGPLLLTAGVGGLCCLAGLAWLARTIGDDGEPPRDTSVLQFLRDGVGLRPDGPGGEPSAVSRTAPAPPPAAPWRTPFHRQCRTGNATLQQRLERLRAALPQRTFHLATDPTNYGERFNQDAFGQPVDPTPRVIVLHETVYGLDSAINTFVTPHPRDEDQVSYHTLVGLEGQVVQVLDPSRRAFGAGNSAFNGEWVITNPRISGSVNNFSLHLSLETPLDGENDGPAHSGYSDAQMDALAVVLANWMERFSIPPERITTHRAVDLGGERMDPRSLDWRGLQERLAALGLLC